MDGKLNLVGYDSPKTQSSGSFLVVDDGIAEMQSYSDKLEILPLAKSLEKEQWLKEHLGPVPKKVLGFFVRALPDAKIEKPLQACFFMKEKKAQVIHNVFVAEKNSQVHLISGCTDDLVEGKHTGISLFFVRENASVSVTRIHHWSPDASVFSKSSVFVGKNAVFDSNYIVINSPKKEQAHSIARVDDGGAVGFNSIIFSRENSDFTISDKILLEGKNARAEIISRAISDGGRILTKTYMAGKGKDTRGHLECDGILLNEKGSIHAIPELEAVNPKTNLSHEAGIGRISETELSYLMARGIDEAKAKSLIVKGFLDAKINRIPPNLQKAIDELVGKISIQA